MTTFGATIIVLALIGAGFVLGLGVTLRACKAQLPAIREEAYTRGLAKGGALARANVMHDLIASDTASAFPEPRRPAA